MRHGLVMLSPGAFLGFARFRWFQVWEGIEALTRKSLSDLSFL